MDDGHALGIFLAATTCNNVITKYYSLPLCQQESAGRGVLRSDRLRTCYNEQSQTQTS